jgi:hypothetical protein
MSKHTASKPAASTVSYCPNASPGRPCTCSECRPWENTCPPGCACLVCLVDGLSAVPSPRAGRVA